MTGLRIRWRREEATLGPSAPIAGASAISLNGALVWLAAGLIVLVAFFARSYNTNWDDNTHLHPDERHLTGVAISIKLPGSISEYFDTNKSRLNPYNPPANTGSFVYGTLPLFAAKTVAVALGDDDYDNMVLVGRHLTALFDAMTVLLVFLIGRRLYGSAAGLLAAVLFGAAPLAIQHAHFFIVDSYLTTFTTAALYFSIRAWQDKRLADCALAGLMLGLGMACKITAALIAPVVVVAVAWQLVQPVRNLWSTGHFSNDDEAGPAFDNPEPRAGRPRRVLSLPCRPALRLQYAESEPSCSMVAEPALAEGPEGPVAAPGRQRWLPAVDPVDRAHQLPLSLHGDDEMGCRSCPQPRRLADGRVRRLPAAAAQATSATCCRCSSCWPTSASWGASSRCTCATSCRFTRCWPCSPATGWWSWSAKTRELSLRWQRPQLAPAGYALAGLIVLVGVLAGAAYFSIYTKPVTRVEASYWMYDHLPAHAQIGAEHWDESVPMQLPGTPQKDFQLTDLKLYDIDSQDKVQELINTLSGIDYITMSSNRLINSIPRDPVNYPVTIRYYEMLFNGQLGFSLVHEFTSYPRLFGLQFPDYRAQESQSSYDHPRVLVFKKNANFSRAKLEQTLGEGPFAMAGLTPAQADKNGLLLKPADLQTQQRGGTWTSVFSNSGIAHSAPTLIWLLALEAAALATLPLAFPDLQPPAGPRLPALEAAGPAADGVPGVARRQPQALPLRPDVDPGLAAALIAVGGVIAGKQRQPLLAFLKSNWRLLLFSEALFLVAFFAFREIRMANPDLWHPYRGGEKPMDLAYLTAVARSTTLPPYDPWFAGGYINYYYFGQFLTATLLKLTTIPPEIGYNLAVPTYFAMTVGGAFSVAYNLAAFARGAIRRTPRLRPIPGWSLYAAGLLGAVFVAVAGNLDGVEQMLDRLRQVSTLHTARPCVRGADQRRRRHLAGRGQRQEPAALRLLALQPHDAADDCDHGVPLLELPLRRLARAHDGASVRSADPGHLPLAGA